MPDTEKTKTPKKSAPPAAVKPTFGIDALVKSNPKQFGNRAALRARLRNADGLQGKYRSGRTWDFGSQKNIDSVAKQLSGPNKPPVKAPKAKKETAAPKAKPTKTAKPAVDESDD